MSQATPDYSPIVTALQGFTDTSAKLADALVLMKRDIRDAQHLRRLLLVAIVLDICVTVAAAIIVIVTVHSSNEVAKINVTTESIRICAVRGQDKNLAMLESCVHDVLTHPAATH